MKKILISFLIAIIICGGCTQNNKVAGDYRNEAHNSQYIVFSNGGTFSHYNYNNTYGLHKTGNFSINNNLLILYYNDGFSSEFNVDEFELIPVNENTSQPINLLRQTRFAKRLEQ
jgi:hypothetical protein